MNFMILILTILKSMLPNRYLFEKRKAEFIQLIPEGDFNDIVATIKEEEYQTKIKGK